MPPPCSATTLKIFSRLSSSLPPDRHPFLHCYLIDTRCIVVRRLRKCQSGNCWKGNERVAREMHFSFEVKLSLPERNFLSTCGKLWQVVASGGNNEPFETVASSSPSFSDRSRLLALQLYFHTERVSADSVICSQKMRRRGDRRDRSHHCLPFQLHSCLGKLGVSFSPLITSSLLCRILSLDSLSGWRTQNQNSRSFGRRKQSSGRLFRATD